MKHEPQALAGSPRRSSIFGRAWRRLARNRGFDNGASDPVDFVRCDDGVARFLAEAGGEGMMRAWCGKRLRPLLPMYLSVVGLLEFYFIFFKH
jgi:hypothetical protein